MADTHDVKYKVTMTRAQWRAAYERAQAIPPKHNSALRWVTKAVTELEEVAGLKLNILTGAISNRNTYPDGQKPDDRVTKTLTRDAILGIKYGVVTALSSGSASLMERSFILESMREVGPNESFYKQVLREAKLPEAPEADAEKLDFEEECEIEESEEESADKKTEAAAVTAGSGEGK